MITVENLSFSYREGFPILKDVNLSLDSRSTAIIGQNGAGKTTFVKLLKNLLKPESGKIYINGQDISKTTAAGLAGNIGLVFQNPNDQIFKNNCMDEVLFGPERIKMPREEATERAESALKTVGLFEKRQVNPQDLGLSERKLLCIASVLAMDTPIIILDEPTIAQDHRGKKKISEIIDGLKKSGKLVITIIHDMDFVAENFERTIIFNKGEIILDGNTREVFSNLPMLKQARVEQPCAAKLSQRLNMEICLNAGEFVESYCKL